MLRYSSIITHKMTLIILIYVLLLIVFLVVSSLVLRHAVKFGYLSPGFKTIVVEFGILAFCVIIFSVYLMLQIGEPSGGGYDYIDTYTESTSTGDLNF